MAIQGDKRRLRALSKKSETWCADLSSLARMVFGVVSNARGRDFGRWMDQVS